MTNDTEHALGDEGTKKRAYALRERAAALGYAVSMTHAYEFVATALGFRNWPTMKAAKPPERDDPSLYFGRIVNRDGFDGFFGPRGLGYPLSRLRDHIEALGTPDKPRRDFIARVTEAALVGDVGSCTVAHLRRDHLRMLRAQAERAKTRLAVIDLNYNRRGKAEEVDMFAEFTVGELRSYLFETVMESYRGVFDDDWKTRCRRFAEALAPLLVWLRDNRGLAVDILSIRDHLHLGTLVGLAYKGKEDVAPEALEKMREYLGGLSGFDEQAARQGVAAAGQHDAVEERFVTALTSQFGLVSIPSHTRNPECVDLGATVLAGGNVVIVVPQNVGEKAGQQAVLNGLLRIVHRSLLARSADSLPFVTVVDNAERYAGVDLQTMLVEATAANAGYVLVSEKTLPLPALKRASSVHIDKLEHAPIHRAHVVTSDKVTEFVYDEIAEED